MKANSMEGIEFWVSK